ncbi:MAG: T9SS type A sorting domain-containing protein [Rhodothermales bacterium]|nr:T9SS type A sorting domain-containing protein [Rhodothermales bacterium]
MQGVPMATGYQWSFWTAVSGGSLDFVFGTTVDIREPGEGGILAYGAYAGDLNNDGWSDLMIPNETPDDFRVFLNDASGGYSDFTIYQMPEANSPSTNEGADFNNDGEIDIVIGSGSGKNVSVFNGTGSGTFQAEVAYEAGVQGAWIRGVCVMDLDGDGWDDIVATTRDADSLSLLRNLGDGTFGPYTSLETNGTIETTCTSADVNLDGIMDVFVGSFSSRTMSLMLGDGEGGFAYSDSISIEGSPWMSVAGDLNGDMIPDVVTAGFTGRNISVVFAESDGTFARADSYPAGDAVIAVDLGDLDADGDLDVVTSNLSSGDWTIFENDGEGNLTEFSRIPASSAGSCAILHDRDNDGDLDLTGIDETDDVIFIYDNPNTVSNDALELKAFVNNGVVSLTWATASEMDVVGFDIERQDGDVQVAEQWMRIGFETGSGTSASPNYYSFEDPTSQSSHSRYRLKEVRRDGSFSYSNVVEIVIDVEPQWLVSSIYPNPFSEFVTIKLVFQGLDVPLVTLFDMTGRRIDARFTVLRDGYEQVTVSLDGANLSNGVYFVRVHGRDEHLSVPIIVSK